MGLGETLMKLVVKVGDAVAVARRFRESPTLAMNELVGHVRDVFAETLERVMHAELELHLIGCQAPPRYAVRLAASAAAWYLIGAPSVPSRSLPGGTT